jgi:hypothetical protein
MRYVCQACGSDDVESQVSAMIPLNRPKDFDFSSIVFNDENYHFCNSCMDSVNIIQEDVYKGLKEPL